MNWKPIAFAVMVFSLFACGCQSEGQKPVADAQKSGADAQKAGAPAAPGGPGDDDDRPVTMSGSSLDVAGDDHKGGLVQTTSDTLTYPYPTLTGPFTAVNEILYRIKTEANPTLGRAVFRRKVGMALSIVITHGPGASPQAELEISADKQENAAGPQMFPANLQIKSSAGANANFDQYERIGKFIFKHPKKSRKVRTITFTGVVMESTQGSPSCSAGIVANTFICTVNSTSSDNDSRLHIKVCRPIQGTCSGPAM